MNNKHRLWVLALLAAFPSKGEAHEVVRCETYRLASPALPDSFTCRDENKQFKGTGYTS